MFKDDISGSELCVNSFSDIEEFTRCYDTTLLNLLDKHAPIKTKKMVMRPVVSWFTDDLKKLKAERRKCERKMLQSGCSHDKELYYKTRDKYSALLRKTKTSYYSDLIDKCSGNSKKLFRVINSLSKQKSSESLPPYEDPLILANEFGTFFGRKIELINDEINKIGVNPITILNIVYLKYCLNPFLLCRKMIYEELFRKHQMPLVNLIQYQLICLRIAVMFCVR